MIGKTIAAPKICRGGNCGHPASAHKNSAGRCTAENHDYYGAWRCVCPYYSEETL